MTRAELLAAFDRIRVWQRGDRRAVHKPLLVLLALARLARGEAPMVEYADLEGQIGRLLREFGPSGSEASRHYPFWHLKTDGVWHLHGPRAIITRPARSMPAPSSSTYGVRPIRIRPGSTTAKAPVSVSPRSPTRRSKSTPSVERARIG